MWLAAFSAAAVLVVARPAAAHPACCVQCVNPHGGTIPSAGSAPICDIGKFPSDKAFNAGFNPDGFFQVGTTAGEGAACTTGTADVDLFTCDVVADVDGNLMCNPNTITPIPPPNGATTFANGTLIKYTEANGVETPTVSPMGSNNGSSSSAQAGAVAFHIKAFGDLLVCSAEGSGCVLCLVPPPPK